MTLPAINSQDRQKPLCYDPVRKKFILFDELVSGSEKIVSIESLSPADLKKLIIERQRRGPDYTISSISGRPFTRDDVVASIERGEEMGLMTVEADASYLKELLRQMAPYCNK